jgi:ribosomal protein S18 acetylase RimI-like enzyme
MHQITNMLARTFSEDPLTHYVFSGAHNIEARLTNIVEIPLRYGLYHGEVHATSANFEGATVWIPSRKASMSVWRMIQAGVLPNMVRMGSEPSRRFSHLGTFMEKQHKLHVPEEHCYLYVLGVDPSHQGEGNASRLLKPMLARLDMEGMPDYLETHNDKNIALYRRFGFEVVEESTLPNTTLVTWAMKRSSSSKE